MSGDPYLYQPREVSLETLALCNANCVFCPYDSLTRKGTQLSSALLDRLIREMAEFSLPFYVAPFKVNEPLLDGRLPDICTAVEEQCPKARLRLFTNGQPLTDTAWTWIGKLKRLEHLWISLNEYIPELYQATMSLSWSKTFGRLQSLHQAMVRGEFRQAVVVSRVSDGNGLVWSAEDTNFRKFVAQTWPLFHVRLIKRDGWLGHVSPANPAIPHSTCGRWWELNICADGKAALCCMDGKAEYSIGDVNESTLLDLYNQSYLIERRQRAKTRIGIEPCQRCTY